MSNNEGGKSVPVAHSYFPPHYSRMFFLSFFPSIYFLLILFSISDRASNSCVITWFCRFRILFFYVICGHSSLSTLVCALYNNRLNVCVCKRVCALCCCWCCCCCCILLASYPKEVTKNNNSRRVIAPGVRDTRSSKSPSTIDKYIRYTPVECPPAAVSSHGYI